MIPTRNQHYLSQLVPLKFIRISTYPFMGKKHSNKQACLSDNIVFWLQSQKLNCLHLKSPISLFFLVILVTEHLVATVQHFNALTVQKLFNVRFNVLQLWKTTQKTGTNSNFCNRFQMRNAQKQKYAARTDMHHVHRQTASELNTGTYTITTMFHFKVKFLCHQASKWLTHKFSGFNFTLTTIPWRSQN